MLDDFARRVVEVHGPAGAAWLREVPARVAACERRWSIAVDGPFAELSYNWVAPGTGPDGAPVVLKLGVPTQELASEIAALRAWAGAGAARLIAADAGEGAILLERVCPGARLADLGFERDDQATAYAAGLMRQLHAAAVPDGLRSLADWTAGLERARAAQLAPALVERAIAVRAELLASSPAPVLLHGDLHHFNILSAERQGWLAIDPKGVAGDPAYEPGPFLYNAIDPQLAAPGLERLVARRVDQFAEHFDRARVLGWGQVQAVLSAWWELEDHGGGHEPALGFAELMARLR